MDHFITVKNDQPPGSVNKKRALVRAQEPSAEQAYSVDGIL